MNKTIKRILSGGTFNELLKAEIPKQEWIIPHIISEYETHIIISPSGSGKTTFSLWLSLHIVSGKNTPFGNTKKAKVMYVDEEMSGRGLMKKGLSLCESTGINPDKLNNLHYLSLSGFRYVSDKKTNNLIEGCYAKGINFIIVDSLIATGSGQLMGLEDAQKVREFQRKCNAKGITVLFLHHTNKEKKYYGSVDVINSFDNVFELNNFTDKIRLKQTKARFGAPEDMLDVNIPFVDMDFGSPYRSKGYEYIDLIKGIFKISDESQLRYTDFKTALVETGEMTEPTLSKYLKACIEQNILRKNGNYYEKNE